MIFMGVRNHNTNDLVSHRAKRGYIRTDHVDTRGGRVVTKGDPDVYQQILAFTTVHVEVHPNLPRSAEWNEIQLTINKWDLRKIGNRFQNTVYISSQRLEERFMVTIL